MGNIQMQCSEEMRDAFCRQSGKQPDQISEIIEAAQEVQAANPRAVGVAVFTVRRLESEINERLYGVLAFSTPRYIESVTDAITDADLRLAQKGWQYLDVLNGPFETVEELEDFAAYCAARPV